MNDSPLLIKSKQFALKIINVCDTLYKQQKEFVLSNQLLRSGTSIGANIREAFYAQSKADFISKLHISLKETSESIYWLTLLDRTRLFDYSYDELLSIAEEIKRMLISSINTAKSNKGIIK